MSKISPGAIRRKDNKDYNQWCFDNRNEQAKIVHSNSNDAEHDINIGLQTTMYDLETTINWIH